MPKIYMRAPNGEVFETSHPEYHKDSENLGSGQKAYAARQEYARATLRKSIKPGQVIYTLVRSVARSGMSRDISLFIIDTDRDGTPYPRNIDNLASDACGISQSKDQGLKVHGCGMDMCFSVVYSLGRALFPDGFGKTGETQSGKKVTPKTAKQAAQFKAAGVIFRGRNGDSLGWDTDGGYALGYSSL